MRSYLVALALLLSGIVFGASLFGLAAPLDKLVYDQMLRSMEQETPADIVIIEIDERSIDKIGKWPWRRSVHAKLINILTEARVKAIAFDVVFSEASPYPQDDQALADALKRSGRVIFPTYIDRFEKAGQLLEVMPHPLFAEHVRIGHVNTDLDEDGIVRHFFRYEGVSSAFWPHFALVVADTAGQLPYPLSYKPTLVEQDYSPYQSRREGIRWIPFVGEVGSFQSVSFYDVVTGRIPPRELRDKIIFVGPTAITLGDLLPTPQTVSGEQMPGVEINANIFQAARTQTFIHGGYSLWLAVVSGVLTLLTVLIIPRIAGREAFFLIIMSTIAIVFVQWAALSRYAYWLPLASMLLGQWLAYPLWMILRLDQTFRYLQRQLAELREALGGQSLVQHNDLDNATVVDKVATLLAMMGCRAFLLYRDQALLHDSTEGLSHDVSQWQNLKLGATHLPHGFCYRFVMGEDTYTLHVPYAKTDTEWSDQQIYYVINFFQRGLVQPSKANPGIYDLVFQHLSDVRTSQEELNNARFLFEYCVREMNDGVVIADEFGSVLFYNRLATVYLGFQEDDHQSLLDILGPHVIKQDSLSWQTVLMGLVTDHAGQELEIVTAQKRVILVSLTYLNLQAERSNLIVINLNDISRIREAQQLRNETINFLSHDMRSPMVSLLALTNQQRSQGNTSKFLDQIEHYANKNLYFAEQFLQLARVESMESLQFYDIDFEAVVQNAVDDVYAQAQQSDVSLKFTTLTEVSCWVKGNGELLERAVVNLVTNAIKYGAEGKVIEIELDVLENQAIMIVRDFGSGIPVEKQALLFAPFQRVYGAKTKSARGAGLGLRFVDVTVKRHGGKVFFQSEPGRTEFGFTLPLSHI